MSDGYPTKECIEFIRRFRFNSKDAMPLSLSSVESLLNCIEENCRWIDFSIGYELGLDVCERNFVVKFYYSTGGWSGHEELIEELKKTWFWYFCWEQSRRGGHYIFEINPNSFSTKKCNHA